MAEDGLSSIAIVSGRRPMKFQVGRIALEARQDMAGWHQALILCAAVLLGFLLSAAILVAVGVGPSDLVGTFIVDNLFVADNLRSVLTSSASLILAGEAAALAFRVRFWNLGIEGQMVWGAIATMAVSIFQIGPEHWRLPLMLVAAILAGAAWVGGTAFLKLRLGVNEIISTLLLNYVAGYFLLHLLFGAWLDPKDSFPHSQQLRAAERLPELAWGIPASLPLALTVALILWWLVRFSRIGIYARIVHANDRMALAIGIPIGAVTVAAVLASGAVAGTAGFVITAGEVGRLSQSFYQGFGFSGVLIAFLARNHPIGVTGVAFLVALLFAGGNSLQIFYQVPFSMVQLIQAIIVMTVAASDFLIRHRLAWQR
jgi:simple sugar transport system permease protein